MSSGPRLPTRFEGPEHSPGFLLWQLSMLWQRRQREALAEVGLTHVQFVLLASAAWLAQHDEPATQVEIASQAKTDVMMTSQVLRALEAKQLLKRQPHPRDTRAKGVTVTPAGHALVKRAIGRVEGVDEEFFAALGGGRKAFVEGMRALIARNGTP